MTETHSILQRVRELTVQAGNTGTQDATTDLQAIQDEVNNLLDEVDGISQRTAFNGKNLLDGTETNGFTFQIGANKGQQLTVNIGNMSTAATGLDMLKADYNVTTATAANTDALLTKVDSAINKVSSERGKLGAVQNRLEHTINNLSASSENLTAAESRIRDVDMAKEMSEFTKNNILSQASQAMLAQANQQPQNVLQLLR